jgi:phosphoglycerate dehydrogenase-like enzyme
MAKRPKRIALHIKNNRAGEEVFRVTPARWQNACRRHPLLAKRIDATIDWDLDTFDASMATAEVLMTWDLPTERLAERAPQLKWIHIIGAGIEHLAPLDWLPPGVTLTNNSGVHRAKAAEYITMALLLLHIRMPAMLTAQRRKRWAPEFTTPIAGRTVTIVGVGQMGAAAAQAARKLGLRVLGVRRSGRPARGVDRIYPPSRLRQALAPADVVILSLPLTDESRGMIGAAELDAMKDGAGLVNIGRAETLDHDALATRLRSGKVSGAVLDVFEREPLPRSHPLWQVPNLIMTPHVSSDDAEDYMPMTLDLLFANVERYLAGQPLKNRVNPKLGY